MSGQSVLCESLLFLYQTLVPQGCGSRFVFRNRSNLDLDPVWGSRFKIHIKANFSFIIYIFLYLHTCCRGSDLDPVFLTVGYRSGFFSGFGSGSRLTPSGSATLLVPQLLLSQSEPEKRAKTTLTKKYTTILNAKNNKKSFNHCI